MTTEHRQPTAGHELPLTSKVFRSGAWVFAGKITSRCLQTVKLVILARLLAPEDFGLFGIVMLAMSAVETFTRTGFDQALIQRQDDIRDHLDTAWTVQFVRSLSLAALLFLGAPLVANFFGEPRSIVLLRVLCLVKIAEGCKNIGVIYWQKNLKFHKRVICDLIQSSTSLAVGISLAFILRNVWALVWSSLFGAVVHVGLSYMMHPFRPRLKLVPAQAKDLFRFGKWMLGGTIVMYLSNNGSEIVLGKLLGPVALGVFQIAHRISNIVSTEITHTSSAVLFPAYAMAQSDRERLRRGFTMAMDTVISLVFPLSAFLFCAAPEFVMVVLGQQWVPAVLPLRILTVAGIIRALAALGGPLFFGTGRPHMDFWMNLGRAVALAVVIYPLTRLYGVAGAAFSLVVALTATLPVWFYGILSSGIRVQDIFAAFSPGVVLALLVAVGVYGGRAIGGWGGIYISFGAIVALSGLLSVAGALLLWRFDDSGPVRQFARFFKSSKKKAVTA